MARSGEEAMAVAEEDDTLGLLVRRQRKEKRELQAKIQGMKNTVPKNDKKRRKQLSDDVAKLEAELEQKHQEELKKLEETLPEQSKEESATINIARLELEDTELIQLPKISKAQKRREKKAALEKEREERIAEAEIENLTGARHLESQKLVHVLSTRQLAIKQIPSDGHCMYRAVEDQLKERQNSWTVATLRSQTAEYVRSHMDDFLPFLTNPNTGDLYSQEEFEKYCYDIANTTAWGGQLELRALSHILKTPIEVVQMDSPTIIVGEEYNRKPLILVIQMDYGQSLSEELVYVAFQTYTRGSHVSEYMQNMMGEPIKMAFLRSLFHYRKYMRHAYGLGEHYNSVKPLSDMPTENES